MSLVSEGADFRGPLTASGFAEPSLATVGDYIALMKPRVMSLVVFTALVGLAVAPGSLHPLTAFTALLCIAVGAGAAGALNMWYDADIDAVMARTSRRPVPMGRVRPGEALAFGLTLAGFAIATEPSFFGESSPGSRCAKARSLDATTRTSGIKPQFPTLTTVRTREARVALGAVLVSVLNHNLAPAPSRP